MIQGGFLNVLMAIESNESRKMNQLAEIDNQDMKVDYLLDFAVIGAGIAGLTAANRFNQQGGKVAVFEKARGTGGRMSSKRVVSPSHDEHDHFMAFDLGCISITAKSEGFATALDELHQLGIIAPWFKDTNNSIHYVGMPRNSGLTRYLSKDLECHFSTRVTAIENLEGVWHLFTLENNTKKLLAKAKHVILATPPAQAYDLLPYETPLKAKLDTVEVDPQWVMGLEVDNLLSDLESIHYPQSDIIHSISQESFKPGRDRHNQVLGNEILTMDASTHSRADVQGSIVLQVQATASWTNNHLELSGDEVSVLLIKELECILKQILTVKNSYSHRWLYSRISQGILTQEGYLWDDKGLALIGDYLSSEFIGIESAWFSGKQLADWLTLSLSTPHA
tara:strand:- start:7284 stop:8462 length:1179 start_codon:yes stop_codon:yes gene_type:complete